MYLLIVAFSNTHTPGVFCCGFVEESVALLLTRGPALGLRLNPAKCEWSWLDPACKDACPIRLDGVSEENQVKLVPREHIQMLGVPLGDGAFVSKFVEGKLLGSLAKNCQSICGV